MVTFHNQRDYIFVRHHRYIYKKEEVKNIHSKDKSIKTRARLQELGPRFTFKLKWLQNGLFDSEFGEYEWIMGKRIQTKAEKKKFFL